MNVALTLSDQAQGQFLGSRQRGLVMRHQLEELLDRNGQVEIDFTGTSATQSFVDELVGVLIYQHGPSLLKRLSFKGCSSDVRAVIKLVAQERAKDYTLRHHQEH